MKSKISNFIKTNKNLSASIFFILLTLLIYREWYILFMILFSTLNISLIINLVNWPYKVFKGESFSFFKQFRVWLSIIPTFISIFLLILFYSTNNIKSFSADSDKVSIERNQSEKVETISDDSVNIDDFQNQLEVLRKERENLEEDINKSRVRRIKELDEIDNELESIRKNRQ
jgi:hypothetical protein